MTRCCRVVVYSKGGTNVLYSVVQKKIQNNICSAAIKPILMLTDVPTCKEEREELYGALKQETVFLKCEVDANPPVVSFQWTFNNSGEQADVPQHRFTSQGTVSRLNYTPVSDMDYGTLSCWGTNSVGQMKTPCVYQVVAAGRWTQMRCQDLIRQL